VAIFIVLLSVWRRLGSDSAEHKPLSETKTLIQYGFPLYLRDLVLVGIRTHLLNFLIVLYTSDILFGNYKVALNFQTALNFVYVPISTILFPTFSKLDIKSDRETLKTMFVSSVKYTSLLIVPVITALLALSEPLVFTLYNMEEFSLAPFYLSLSALTFIYAAFGQTSIVQLLGSQGQTRKTMLLGIASAALALVLALILIPHLQIAGLILSLIISGSPTVILGSWWVKKLYDFTIDWNQTGKILACSFCTCIITFVTFRFFLSSNLLGLAIGLVIFLTLFFILSPLMGAINIDDICNLRSLFSETPIIGRAMEIPLWLLSKSCKFADRVKHLGD
jgi:O-antigen/teichoic acid export membrane protein